VDYLKIDGMFVKVIVEDSINRAMVKSINEIVQNMQMTMRRVMKLPNP
jgi:EAL domain-containing protein (putative c-di-GMP-specific phosphodiesterase class I)